MKHLPLLFAAALLPSSALAAPAPSADRAALQALAAATDAAWDNRDVQAMMRTFAADGTLRLSGMPAPVQGSAALRAFFTQGFAARAGELRHVTSIDHVELAGPHVAVADGHVAIQRRSAAGAWETVRTFANTTIAVREDGVWKLSAVRGVPINQPAAPSGGR